MKKAKKKVKAKRGAKKNQLVVAKSLPPPQSMEELYWRAMKDPSVDVNKLRELLAIKSQENALAAISAYAIAMNAAQSEMEPVRKDCENKQTHSKYASYLALDRAIRPIYAKHGFALTYNTKPSSSPDVMLVTCDVLHKHGHKEHHEIPVPIVTTGPQGKDVMTKTHAAMSADTYGMRRLLQKIFNIAVTDDDDGNAAGGSAITEEQAVVLRKRLNEAVKHGYNENKFYAHFGISTINELPLNRLGPVIIALENYIEEKSKKAPEQAQAG